MTLTTDLLNQPLSSAPDKRLDGRRCADTILDGLRALIPLFPVRPQLVVIRVGDDPASATYVNAKRKACERVGIESAEYHLAADITAADLSGVIEQLNADPHVHGILLQLPLPSHLDSREFIRQIDPTKDVDGFHPANLGLLFTGQPRFVPCTPLGIMALLRAADVQFEGLDAVVVGRSLIVGRPMALLLEQANATVTICHTRTRSMADHIRRADLLVVAAGRPQIIPGDWVKEGAVVVDVGIHRDANQKLCGDVVYAAAAERARLITPVPGGVGPMTVAMLIYQTARSAALRSTQLSSAQLPKPSILQSLDALVRL